MQKAFTLIEPDNLITPVVVASPHSGRHYPDDLLRASVLDSHALRASEDAFVDQLIADVPQMGAPLLLAEYPRAYVDLNRNIDELDPAVIADLPRRRFGPRVAGGLGVIPRVVAAGRPIYSGKLSLPEATSRLTHIWHPYHNTLTNLLARAQAQFGQAVLIDMHSMPRASLGDLAGQDQNRPDIVLGNRFGRAASDAITDIASKALADAGLRVALNTPFAGAFIAERYGQPARGTHVLQLEIDRSLYMDEATLTPLPGYDDLKSRLTQAVGQMISAIGQSGRQPTAAQ